MRTWCHVPVPSFYIYLCSELTLPTEVPHLTSNVVVDVPVNILRGAWSGYDYGYSNYKFNVGLVVLLDI